MAPSSSNPSNLHRAPVACHRCRAAKVRCLVSLRSDRCDRCIGSNGDCVFTPPKRSRVRSHPYLHGRRPTSAPEATEDGVLVQPASQLPSPSPSTPRDPVSARPLPTTFRDDNLHSSYSQQALITAETRARIVLTLASLRGKRGSPFSFVTSGDRPALEAITPPGEPAQDDPQPRQSSHQPQLMPPSLKLSWLLFPLKSAQADNDDRPPVETVKMPSYLSSMMLCQTITDPIEAGILTRAASLALFTHFMIEMNTKWEYILDPHIDSHDSVRQRSRLLFATILFCSSKFATYSDSSATLLLSPEPFLQNRLCNLARSLAIKAFAKGDRSIETMQALYLLVCWKDADDDISYLHSGYAFRVLNDLDLERSDGDGALAARRMRTWLALFRQDKQQSLFFIRGAPLGLGGGDLPSIGNPEAWIRNPHALPLDFVAGCSADLRRIQSRLRGMVQKASSPAMLPCLLELMDAELRGWDADWRDHLLGESRLHPNDDGSLDQRLLCPDMCHLQTLVGLWGHSVRLNVASAVFRQALIISVTSSASDQPQPSSLGFHASPTVDFLPPDAPGLASSIEGAFGTLQHLLAFPTEDLRRAPDSVLLLAPSAALFLFLLLGFQPTGILGPSFQRTAIGLIQDVARHVKQSIKSPQDTVNLHSAYLDSIVDLLTPTNSQKPTSAESSGQSDFDATYPHPEHASPLDYTALQAAQVLAGGMGGPEYDLGEDEGLLGFGGEPDRALHMQSLVNLLDAGCFWEGPPMATDLIT